MSPKIGCFAQSVRQLRTDGIPAPPSVSSHNHHRIYALEDLIRSRPDGLAGYGRHRQKGNMSLKSLHAGRQSSLCTAPVFFKLIPSSPENPDRPFLHRAAQCRNAPHQHLVKFIPGCNNHKQHECPATSYHTTVISFASPGSESTTRIRLFARRRPEPECCLSLYGTHPESGNCYII